MGKGSKPRNCFSVDFRDNYDAINWKEPKADEWSESSEIFKGMVRQSSDIKLQDESCDCESEQEDSCA